MYERQNLRDSLLAGTAISAANQNLRQRHKWHVIQGDLTHAFVRKRAAANTEYAYDEAGHLLGEYNGSGTAIQETAYIGDIPVAVLAGSGGTTYNVVPDWLNTPHIVIDGFTHLAWSWDHLAWGDNAPNNFAPFKFDTRSPLDRYLPFAPPNPFMDKLEQKLNELKQQLTQ